MTLRNLNRRVFLRAVWGTASSTALVACAATLTPTATPAPRPTAAVASAPAQAGPGSAPSGSIELYFARTTICRLCGAVDYWNQQHPAAKVVDRDVPWTSNQQQAALAAKKGGPDLYQADPDEVQRDMIGGKLLDVTDAIKPIADSYLPYKLDQFRNPKTNKVFAFPWQVGVSVMYYRQDLLQKLGMSQFPVGWSWDQHEQLAKKAKTDLKVFTTWLGDGQNDKDSNLFLQMVWQAGGTFISKDWSKVELNSPICVAVAKRLREWWQNQLIFEGSFYTAPLWGAMRTGQLWMTADPSWWILGMRDNISKPEDHVGDWRVAPLPVATAGGARTANEGGGGLAAPAYTANPDLVKAFGAFATTDLHATIPTIQMGTVVAAKSSFTDPASLNITFAVTGDQKVNQIFADLVGEVPSTFYYSASWNEIRHILTQNLMPIIKGDVGVEPGLAKIVEDATKANDRWLKLLEQEKA